MRGEYDTMAESIAIVWVYISPHDEDTATAIFANKTEHEIKIKHESWKQIEWKTPSPR